jgi:hypothetical protein
MVDSESRRRVITKGLTPAARTEEVASAFCIEALGPAGFGAARAAHCLGRVLRFVWASADVRHVSRWTRSTAPSCTSAAFKNGKRSGHLT